MLTSHIGLNVLIAGLLGYFIASVGKIVLSFFRKEKVNLMLAFGTGGMPSSHSATVCALATSILLHEGFTTTFVISFFFAAIVMADAFGVRLETGEQAKALNKIAKKQKMKVKQFNELAGHTPVQVFCGALVGIGIGVLMYFVQF